MCGEKCTPDQGISEYSFKHANKKFKRKWKGYRKIQATSKEPNKVKAKDRT